MKQEYIKFFEILPKHTQLSIQMLVPNKFPELNTEILSCVFVKHGIIKKCICDCLYDYSYKVVDKILKQNNNKKELVEFESINVTTECEILLRNFLFFMNKYEDIIDSDIITNYVSTIMITDDRLLSYSFFKKYCHKSQLTTVTNDLSNSLYSSTNFNPSSVNEILKYGRWMLNPYKVMDLEVCFGRDKEICEISQILGRMNKRNAILTGNPGVGKTNVIHGLCQLLQSENCPKYLKNCYMIQLDINSVISGTMYRGDLEQRMQNIIDCLDSNNDLIIFIDEIHTIMGNGSSTKSESTNISSYLKELLTKGCRIIGCTTNKEYKLIEKDKALERRFTVVPIKEPTVYETVNILKNKKFNYEKFHNIEITDSICEYIVKKCDLFMRYKYFPDKALDILDRSCVMCSEKLLSSECVDICILQHCKIPSIKNEKFNFNEISNEIKQCIIGQDHAIDLLIQQVKKYYYGMCFENKPIASLLFVGPTGVGKTELCKQVSNYLFPNESFLRLDMSDYMESGSITKLIGSSPGYVGYEEGGVLTQHVKRHPYSFILVDEVEKANINILNIFLQIMDDGRLRDSYGDVIDFSNTLLVFTSNIGCRNIYEKTTLGFANNDYVKIELDKSVKNYFSPEFRNRLTKIVYFNELTKENNIKILNNIIKDCINKYKDRLGLDITVNKNVYSYLIDKCTEEKTGVRFLYNKIVSYLDKPIFDSFEQSVKSVELFIKDNEIIWRDKNEK